jgi:acyl-coenzyme A synthetase/AMP-(fatty) acid ligase
MIANMLGVETLPIKPGSVGKAVCGYDIKIFNEEMKCKQSTRICGGKTPTTSRNVA